MKPEDYKEHIKLRDDADSNLRSIEKLQREDTQRNDEAQTKTKVNELIAANAATQATVAAMAEDNSNTKAMLAQLLQMQATQNKKVTETETEHSTEPKTKLPNDNRIHKRQPKPNRTLNSLLNCNPWECCRTATTQ